MILKLVQSHRLRLNDPISTWEPGVPNARRITIRMLLNMTSGIWDEGGVGPDGQPSSLSTLIEQNCGTTGSEQRCSRYWPPQTIVNLAIQDSKNVTHGPAYPPGVWYYSDTNYVILAIIAQDVTGKPFGVLLKDLVLDPLHLNQTSFPTRTLALPAPSATGHRININSDNQFTGYVAQLQPSPSALFGAGNVVSTVHDLQVWARALATGALLTPRLQRLRLQLVQTGLEFSPLVDTSPTIGLPVQYGLGIADAGGMLGHKGSCPATPPRCGTCPQTAERWWPCSTASPRARRPPKRSASLPTPRLHHSPRPRSARRSTELDSRPQVPVSSQATREARDHRDAASWFCSFVINGDPSSAADRKG